MFLVIYRNQLRQGKTIKDFKDWWKTRMPARKKWGADSQEIYTPLYGEARIVFTKYKIESLDKWHKAVASPEGLQIIDSLDEIIDTAVTTVEIMSEVDLTE